MCFKVIDKVKFSLEIYISTVVNASIIGCISTLKSKLGFGSRFCANSAPTLSSTHRIERTVFFISNKDFVVFLLQS